MTIDEIKIALSTVYDCVYMLPKNENDNYVKGTYTLDDGSFNRFEVPAIFEEGVLKEEESITKVYAFIVYQNKLLNEGMLR